MQDARTILEQASKHFDACEVFYSDSHSITANYDDDHLEGIDQKGTTGAALRAAKEGKVALATTSKPEQAGAIVDAARALTPYGRPYNFNFASKADANFSLPTSAAIGDISASALLDIISRAKDTIKTQAPDALFSGGISTSQGEHRVLTSAGQETHEPFSAMSAVVAASCKIEGDFLQVYSSVSSCDVVTESDMDQIIERTVTDFNAARTPVSVSGGSYRVLFEPEAVAALTQPIKVSISGSSIEKKTSRWLESLGQAVLDPRITITDDPSIDYAVSSSAFDGEGMPTQKRHILEAGVLKGFIHSLATAAATESEPTGNGARSLSSMPSCGLHNFVMEGGEHSVEDLIKEAEGGLLVKNLLGTFTSNFLAGQVSGNISLGFPIKDGKRTGRIKNAALNLNTFEMFQPTRLIGLSKERRWVGGSLLPYILLDGVVIAG